MDSPKMTAKILSRQSFLLMVMRKQFPIKRYLNVVGFACLYVLVCACHWVGMHIAVLLHESFGGL